MRRRSRFFLAWLARGVFSACCLAVIALAVAGTIEGELGRRTAQAETLRLRDWAGVADLASKQRQRLASGEAGAPTGTSRMTEVLRRLQRRSDGSEARTVTALQVSYVTALQRLPSSRELRTALGALQVTAHDELHTYQQRRLEEAGTSRLDQAELAATALLVAASLLGLLRLGLRRLPRTSDNTRNVQFEELRAQARTDSLTQLGNHRAFHHDISTEISRRTSTGSHFTLMAVDLDGLKQINDARGHPAGDAHINGVTRCLETVVGDEGTIYRTGGDEFMVILPSKRNWDALLLANRIDQATRQLRGMRAVSIGLTESTGLESRQLLVHQADLALYEAKRTKLSAVTYHSGLASGPTDGSPGSGPSREQRALAAALARAVDAKDNGTRSHSEMVAELSVAVGRRLGIGGAHLERLGLAGLLHDVGKIGVADAILQKNAALAADEQAAMADHVTIGHAILVAAELPTEAAWILHHHERYDGGGYPAGRAGEDIPLESRVISTADAFEAMTGMRGYRDSITTEDAVAELRRQAGSQFDARCVEALAEVVQDAPAARVLPSLHAELQRATSRAQRALRED